MVILCAHVLRYVHKQMHSNGAFSRAALYAKLGKQHHAKHLYECVIKASNIKHCSMQAPLIKHIKMRSGQCTHKSRFLCTYPVMKLFYAHRLGHQRHTNNVAECLIF